MILTVVLTAPCYAMVYQGVYGSVTKASTSAVAVGAVTILVDPCPMRSEIDGSDGGRLHLSTGEWALACRGLNTLGLEQCEGHLRRIAVGRSGASVFAVEVDGRPSVLKVTSATPFAGHARVGEIYRAASATALREFMPTLRAGGRDDDGVYLLLQALDPYPAAPSLTQPEWQHLATRLGRLHSAPMVTAPSLRPSSWPTDLQVDEARGLWGAYGFASLSQQAAGLLAQLRYSTPNLEPVLTHGDCHVDNLVCGVDGRARWVDWQEASASSGLADLVFLWQRAEAAGAQPPRPEMIHAYAHARSLTLDEDLRCALQTVELRLLLVSWPHFLGYGGSDRIRAMGGRLRQLVLEVYG